MTVKIKWPGKGVFKPAGPGCGRCAVSGILFQLVVLALTGCAQETEAQPSSCNGSEQDTITLGAESFVIPAGLEADLIFKGDGQEEKHIECLDGKRFVDADGFSFILFNSTHWSDVRFEVSEAIQEIYPVQIIVRRISVEGEHPNLRHFYSLLETRRLSYDELPFEDSLFCLKPSDADTLRCITKPDYSSPIGKPLTYQCGSPMTGFRDGRWEDIGRGCSSSYYLSTELMITIRFRDKSHPKETWLSHDQNVRAFLKTLQL